MSSSRTFSKGIVAQLTDLRRKRRRALIEALESLDSRRIYVENVRAICRVSHDTAQRLLDIGVKEGSFVRHVGLLCPYESHIVESFRSDDTIPDSVYCFNCEADGRDDSMHPTKKMRRQSFYSFVR